MDINYFDIVERKKMEGEMDISCARGWMEYGFVRECSADRKSINIKNLL